VDTPPVRPAERLQQRAQIVAPVAQPSRGIHGQGLATAEAAQVWSDNPKALGQGVCERSKKATSGQIAVHEQQWLAILGALYPAMGL
jgi:hypothetical protein